MNSNRFPPFTPRWIVPLMSSIPRQSMVSAVWKKSSATQSPKAAYARRLSRNLQKSSGLKDEQVTSQKENFMNNVTKSIILTALAISAPAPASAFSRGGGGFHGSGFHAG